MRRAATVLLTAAALLGAGCGGGDDGGGPDAATGGPTTTAESSGRGGPGVTVAAQDFAFEPQEIRIVVGEEVTWRNDGQAAHTVAAAGGPGPRSSELSTGDTYTWRAEQAGTVDYVCTIHANMTGRIVIEE